MTQRPMRSKSRSPKLAKRLQLEQLESRTVLASSVMHDVPTALHDVPSAAALQEAVQTLVANSRDTRAPAFVAVMKSPLAEGDFRDRIATVVFRPEVLDLPEVRELDTKQLSADSFQMSFTSGIATDDFVVMNSMMRMGGVTFSGVTIRYGEPIIRNPGRDTDTSDFPTSRPSNPGDPISSPPQRAFDSESWLISQALDAEDEMLYELGQASTTWSEAYAQSTVLNPAAVDHIWNTVANITVTSDEEMPSEQLEHEMLDNAGESKLVSLDDIESLEADLVTAKGTERSKSAAAEEAKQRQASKLAHAFDSPEHALADSARANAVVINDYDEGGLVDVAAVSSDTRLVHSPLQAVLQRVTPDFVSTGNMRDALGLLPKEWSADAADEATEGDEAPSLSTAYLGSFAVVVAAGLGVVIERKRRAKTPEELRQQELADRKK